MVKMSSQKSFFILRTRIQNGAQIGHVYFALHPLRGNCGQSGGQLFALNTQWASCGPAMGQTHCGQSVGLHLWGSCWHSMGQVLVARCGFYTVGPVCGKLRVIWPHPAHGGPHVPCYLGIIALVVWARPIIPAICCIRVLGEPAYLSQWQILYILGYWLSSWGVYGVLYIFGKHFSSGS